MLQNMGTDESGQIKSIKREHPLELQKGPKLSCNWAEYNHLINFTKLSNRYLTMRHGQSLANIQGIVITDPAVGTVSYGLTELGKQQAEQNTLKFISSQPTLSSDTIVLSSDFLRASETAEIARKTIGAATIEHRIELRERGFGSYESGPATIYNDVWNHDRLDPFHTQNNVESLISMLDRTTRLVAELEQKYNNRTLLLVAHGDTCLLLQTGFLKIDPAEFQSAGRFANAEIRELSLHV